MTTTQSTSRTTGQTTTPETEAPDLDVVVDLLRVLPPYDIQIHPTVDVTP